MYTTEEAREMLATDYGVTKGDTLYTTLDHVTKSGEKRWIKVHVVKDGKIYTISHLVAIVTDNKHNTRGHTGVEVQGNGMDMGFKIVSDLALWMFGDGYALKHRWL